MSDDELRFLIVRAKDGSFAIDLTARGATKLVALHRAFDPNALCFYARPLMGYSMQVDWDTAHRIAAGTDEPTPGS